MPKIGVFWFYKYVVFGRAINLEMAENLVLGILDSPDTHADLWDTERRLLEDFPELCGREYFSIPRGRVLWDLKASSAKIYMDSVLFTKPIKQLNLKYFDLEMADVQWGRGACKVCCVNGPPVRVAASALQT